MSSTRTRLTLIVSGVAIAVAASAVSVQFASADIESGDRPVFVPIQPCRLIDTRPATNVGPQNGPFGPGRTITFQAHGSNGECTISPEATGLSMNVTATGATQRTFLTFWGDGANPGTSNLNPEPGQPPTPNSVSTPLSPTGQFNIFNNAGQVNVIVDVNGYYAPHNHDDRYYTETESDGRYFTKTESDGRYLPRAALEGTDFVASGFVEDNGATSTVVLNAPSGVTATVTPGSDGDGLSAVTLSGVPTSIDHPVVLLTAEGDLSPEPGTSQARSCSLLAVNHSGSQLAFGVACVGENTVDPGRILAEDSSYYFIVTG